MKRTTESQEHGYDLAMHLIGRHKNLAAVYNSPADNGDAHDWDHHGPCGIRNHPFADRSYDAAEVEAALEEAEAEEAG